MDVSSKFPTGLPLAVNVGPRFFPLGGPPGVVSARTQVAAVPATLYLGLIWPSSSGFSTNA
jgi:hypothetical protein